MSTRANYREAAGSVILGRIRDLAEHNDLNYPVWSYGVGTTAGQPVVKVVGINVPISVKVTSVDGEEEKITVLPNDWVVADENGVVRIPIDHRDGAEAEIKLDKVLEYIPKSGGRHQREQGHQGGQACCRKPEISERQDLESRSLRSSRIYVIMSCCSVEHAGVL
ncbi:hypothetical protein CJJ09_000195 [Candidozyma auris]|nr:hypothetical protein CJJ09_000195 [[Candida] auris]